MPDNFDGAGNFFNKYESDNPIVKILVKIFFSDLTAIITPIRPEIKNAFEIGCGEGYITSFFNQLGIETEGADVSVRIIELARKKYPSINFSVLSIYDLDTIRNEYSLVIANEVFEHLSEPDKAIERLKKVTTKYILITVPNEPFFRIANILRLKYLKDAGNTPGHLNHWSKKMFEQFLVSHTLKINTIRSSTLWTIVLCEKQENII
jgi:SAM-dependent methyltransferase